ncbi:hypothetical protein HaLaN_02011 [Haematococcus lacustris]|uniref:Uncharacterized protein n=1 Tax=Haematococcus lacustris TaxID=44745 RepID=A0A699YCY5_HAELA|nr:hypothetical protein HaLaN_02011 [Haematococcus lacustris]
MQSEAPTETAPTQHRLTPAAATLAGVLHTADLCVWACRQLRAQLDAGELPCSAALINACATCDNSTPAAHDIQKQPLMATRAGGPHIVVTLGTCVHGQPAPLTRLASLADLDALKRVRQG